MSYGCSKAELYVDDNQFEKSANLPDHVKQYGKLIAKELNGAINNLSKKGVDYSDADGSPKFKERFYRDFFEASPSMIKTRGSIDVNSISSDEFVRRIKSLSKIQLEFIEMIIRECENSTSYTDLSKRLININKKINTRVPEIEKERLFCITTVLYYGMKEINQMEEQGLMPLTPQNNKLLIKTRSESSFGDSCRRFLATTWAIAIGEPTPAGEIVASVVTVFVAGVWMYEVITCSKSSSTSGSEYSYCIGKYVGCTDYTPWLDCGTCLANCLTQGVWPYWLCL